MLKHTPGPWFARYNGHFWDVRPDTPEAGINGYPYTVGNVCSSNPNDAHCGLQEANARLFAAAPELLEALELLLTHTVDADLAAGFALTEGEQEAREAALAAIAKARGVA